MREDRNLLQVVIGLGVLAFGVLFTLDNMGVIDARDYLQYWPLVLVGIGVAQIIQSANWSGYIGAVIWLLAGLWFLGRNIGLIRVSIGDLWPLVVAGVGALLVFRGWRGYDRRENRGGFRPGTAPGPGADPIDDDGWVTPMSMPSPPPALPPFREAERRVPPPDPSVGGTAGAGASGDTTVNAFVLMGGITRRLVTQDFKGGTVFAVMGGAKIDLRLASIAQGEAVIDTLAFWGGIEIRVPEDWVIVPQVFPFMGGFEDRTGQKPAGTRKRLIVRGLAFMGGLEVKH